MSGVWGASGYVGGIPVGSISGGSVNIDVEYIKFLDDNDALILLKAYDDPISPGIIIQEWFYPSDLNTPVAAPTNPKPILLQEQRLQVGSEAINADDSVIETLTVPPTANFAEVIVNNEDCIFTVDGTNPDNTVGALVGMVGRKENVLELESLDELNNFKVLALEATKITNITIVYYNVIKY